MRTPPVTPDDDGIRPAGPPDACLYCKQKVGDPHLAECVTVKRTVVVRMTVEYEVDVPQSWDKEQIEFHRNEGSWCANNALDELAQLHDAESAETCLCPSARFEYVGEAKP